MKLLIEINGNATELELVQANGSCRFRLGNDPEAVAQVEPCEPGVYSILWNGRSYEARVEPGPERLIVAIDGQRFEIVVRDPRRWNRSTAGSGLEGRHHLTAPMPGKVVRVLAAPGDAVQQGQGILVVEAMKMQNEIKASRAGRVVAIAVRQGATVAAGEVLATIE